MKPIFKINIDKTNHNTVSIHSSHIEEPVNFLSFGINKIPIQLNTNQSINTNEMSISENIFTLLGIPLLCHYEIFIQNDTLIIGPYIGILVPNMKKAVYRCLKDLNSYVINYREIGGAIVAFSLDDTDTQSYRIFKGYLYNPLKQCWELMNNLPFPTSIFNKCKVDDNPKWALLSSLYENRIFNYPTFNKWDMYKWFQKEQTLKDLLPKTTLCNKPNDVLKFIQKYPKAFLKPIGGSIAKGIVEVTLYKDKYYLRYQKRKQPVFQTLENKQQMLQFIKKIFRNGRYLIQEAINLLSVHDQIIDFRLIYLKNNTGLWEDMGLFARYGKPGSAVSNITAGGKTKLGKIALSELFSEEKAKGIFEKMLFYCRIASSILEKHLIQCGNLGFDFAIDEQHKLWIIEINNEDPDHRIAYVAKQRALLYSARTQNLLYAKFLAGFS